MASLCSLAFDFPRNRDGNHLFVYVWASLSFFGDAPRHMNGLTLHSHFWNHVRARKQELALDKFSINHDHVMHVGRHNAEWWVDLGKRMSSSSAPVFAVCHAAVYKVLTPHVLFVQKPGSLPDARQRSIAKVMKATADLKEQLVKVREWAKIVPLLWPYLGDGESARRGVYSVMRSIVRAPLNPLTGMVAEMFGSNTYRGLQVTVDWPEPQVGNIDVHHACFCLSGKDHEPLVVRRMWCGKKRWVYRWAFADGVVQPFRAKDPQRDPWRCYSEVVPNAWGQQGLPPKAECRVERRCSQIAVEIDKALTASIEYIVELRQQINEYIIGDVGLHRDLQLRWKLASECYSLVDLATTPVDDKAVAAFAQSYRLAASELEHSLLPPVSEWGRIRMPRDPPVEQYREFAGRIREAWQQELKSFTEGGKSPRGWVNFEGVMAVSLNRLPPVCRAFARDVPWSCLLYTSPSPRD